jgi:hypothetical protein
MYRNIACAADDEDTDADQACGWVGVLQDDANINRFGNGQFVVMKEIVRSRR